MKNVFLYKKKKLLYYKYNICYLFKKKEFKKNFLLLKGYYLFNLFKKFFVYNIYAEDINIDFFLVKYNIIKNF